MTSAEDLSHVFVQPFHFMLGGEYQLFFLLLQQLKDILLLCSDPRHRSNRTSFVRHHVESRRLGRVVNVFSAKELSLFKVSNSN